METSNRRPMAVLIATWGVVALATLALVSCAPEPLPTKILLSDGAPATRTTPAPTRPPLRIAVAGVISPKATLKSYETLVQYFARKLDRPVELVLRPTYAEINDLVRSKVVTLAFVCGGAYVEGQKDFGMELLVAPEVQGQRTYRSYLIVAADSSARSLADLRGKTFAFSDPLSNSGRYVPTYQLFLMGETPDTFFSSYVFTYSHDNSVRAVMDRLVEGAAVDSLVYDALASQDPQVRAKTKVIWQSPPYGIPPVVVHPALDPATKESFRKLFLDLKRDPEGYQVLESLGIDGFFVPSEQDYESIRVMVAALREKL